MGTVLRILCNGACRNAMVALMLSMPLAVSAQLTLVDEKPDNPDNEPVAVFPVPSERQVQWNETEFYAFFHYGMNTYTGKEWGNGDESETTFAPTAVPNPEQWLKACKDGGMKGGIAVVKHHDGFCLWPTATTTHCVSNSSGYGSQTNVPEAFGKAAKALGMKYGFYVSPWDRNSGYYGTQDYIDKVFIPQCEELAQYGDDQFEMWFDGANGGDGYYGGKNTTISIDGSVYYDVPNLRYKVHQLAKNCVMWGVGGEARWIGNEEGYGSETCWSTHPMGGTESTYFTGIEDSWLWNAPESDAKATTYQLGTQSGWFWHSGESPRSAEKLFQMYLETVGRNATFILNFPPNKAGLLPDKSVSVLKELGEMLTKRLGTDLALTAASVKASEERTEGTGRDYKAQNACDGSDNTYWCTNDGTTTGTLTIDLGTAKTLHYVMLQEYIRKGQRVQEFNIEYSADGLSWTKAATGITQSTIGYKRIIPLSGSTEDSYDSSVSARYVRVNITKSKACPLLKTVSLF